MEKHHQATDDEVEVSITYGADLSQDQLARLRHRGIIEHDWIAQETMYGLAECGCTLRLPYDDFAIYWHKCARHRG